MEIKLKMLKTIQLYALLQKDYDTSQYMFKITHTLSDYYSTLSGITNLKLSFIKKILFDAIYSIDESKNILIEKYKTVLENGNVVISPENIPSYTTEMMTILSTEKTFKIDPLKISDFENTKLPIEITDMLVDLIEI